MLSVSVSESCERLTGDSDDLVGFFELLIKIDREQKLNRQSNETQVN